MEKKEFLRQLNDRQLQRFLNNYNQEVQNGGWLNNDKKLMNKVRLFECFVEYTEDPNEPSNLTPSQFLDFVEEHWI